MAALVFALLVATTCAAALTAQEVVDDNEERLLVDRTSELASVLESLGTTIEVEMGTVGAVAQVTDGDASEFRAAVLGVDSGAEDAVGGWALLTGGPAGFTAVEEVGSPTPVGELPPDLAARLPEAAEGRFVALGYVGTGMARRLALATGGLGVAGDHVVYRELSLVGATASAAQDSGDSGGEDLISGLALAVYVGSEPDPDQLLIALGEPAGDVQSAVVSVSGVDVLLQVEATDPLGGGLAARLPMLMSIAGVVLGLAIASVVELTMRRRDDALATVADLEQKNVLLDRALAEQHQAEVARAALEAELRQVQRLEAVGHLAGGVAHDFNNVLTAILSYASLAADSVTEPQAREDLAAIEAAARRGAALTRQLLQFSGRDLGEVVPVDLNERTRDVASMLERTLGDGVDLRTELVPGPASVLANPIELDQVVLNLIVNARDAVEAGGSILARVDEVDLDGAGSDLPTGLDPGRYVRLTVADDGCGMAPEVLEHAFEPFFTSKGRGQGTGLGLSTVYGIVSRLGGHVSARSTPGEGTTVEVLLPAVAQPAADAVVRPAVEAR